MKPALKKGGVRIYFPDHPDHSYNGATFFSKDQRVATKMGRDVAYRIFSLEDTIPNRFGEAEKPLAITVHNFDNRVSNWVLVKIWKGPNKEPEYLYLI